MRLYHLIGRCLRQWQERIWVSQLHRFLSAFQRSVFVVLSAKKFLSHWRFQWHPIYVPWPVVQHQVQTPTIQPMTLANVWQNGHWLLEYRRPFVWQPISFIDSNRSKRKSRLPVVHPCQLHWTVLRRQQPQRAVEPVEMRQLQWTIAPKSVGSWISRWNVTWTVLQSSVRALWRWPLNWKIKEMPNIRSRSFKKPSMRTQVDSLVFSWACLHDHHSYRGHWNMSIGVNGRTFAILPESSCYLGIIGQHCPPIRFQVVIRSLLLEKLRQRDRRLFSSHRTESEIHQMYPTTSSCSRDHWQLWTSFGRWVHWATEAVRSSVKKQSS